MKSSKDCTKPTAFEVVIFFCLASLETFTSSGTSSACKILSDQAVFLYNKILKLSIFIVKQGLFLLSSAENQKGQLEKSCSHHSISLNLTRSPVTKEVTYDVETSSSTGWNKAVGRKEACHGESNKEKKTEPVGSPSKREAMPEVDALLARLRAL